jgi:hypothetical protein
MQPGTGNDLTYSAIEKVNAYLIRPDGIQFLIGYQPEVWCPP